MSLQLKINLMSGLYGIAQLNPNQAIPSWPMKGAFFSVTKTNEELSIVCAQENIPSEVTCERAWRVFRLIGPFAFNEVGILMTVTQVLAESDIGVFALSTFNTDYIMVKQSDVEKAINALRKAHHTVHIEITE